MRSFSYNIRAGAFRRGVRQGVAGVLLSGARALAAGVGRAAGHFGPPLARALGIGLISLLLTGAAAGGALVFASLAAGFDLTLGTAFRIYALSGTVLFAAGWRLTAQTAAARPFAPRVGRGREIFRRMRAAAAERVRGFAPFGAAPAAAPPFAPADAASSAASASAASAFAPSSASSSSAVGDVFLESYYVISDYAVGESAGARGREENR